MQSTLLKWMIPILLLGIALVIGCGQEQKPVVVEATNTPSASLAHIGKEKLSEYGFFQGNMADQSPVASVVPYELNSPLFSDYAHKLRFIQLPDGQQVAFNEKEVLQFPEGTHIVKTFYYPNDFRDESKGRKLMETRVLINEASGWKSLPYIWNDEQTEAYLEVAGDKKSVSWTHYDGSQRELEYVMPNMNQCKGCHALGKEMSPIGPSARQLNRMMTYPDGSTKDQLDHWKKNGIITDLPEKEARPKLAVWNDPESGNLDDRARAYLEINCAHCHRPEGPANTSGLFLTSWEENPHKWGVNKSPIAAGRGSGGRLHDIVPGKPEESILYYRMDNTDPGEMMPELGRRLNHDEGLALIKDWIASMDPEEYEGVY